MKSPFKEFIPVLNDVARMLGMVDDAFEKLCKSVQQLDKSMKYSLVHTPGTLWSTRHGGTEVLRKTVSTGSNGIMMEVVSGRCDGRIVEMEELEIEAYLLNAEYVPQ